MASILILPLSSYMYFTRMGDPAGILGGKGAITHSPIWMQSAGSTASPSTTWITTFDWFGLRVLNRWLPEKGRGVLRGIRIELHIRPVLWSRATTPKLWELTLVIDVGPCSGAGRSPFWVRRMP